MRRLSGYVALGSKLTQADELDIRIAAHRDYYPTEIGLPDVMPADIYNISTLHQFLKMILHMIVLIVHLQVQGNSFLFSVFQYQYSALRVLNHLLL